MRTLTDPADDLLARTDDLEIHTQNTMQLDSAPDFHGASEDEEALFAGLSGKPAKRVRLPKQAGVKQVRAGSRPSAGFLPGMGDLDGPAKRVVRPQPRPAARGFLPGMGSLDGAPVRAKGFLPGMGDITIAGMGLGTVALIGVGAWLLLRKRA